MAISSLSTAFATDASVAVITDDSAAIEAAQQLAADLRPGAVARDATRDPGDGLDLLRRSGLLGITVPAAFGGADVSRRTVTEVFRLTASADSSVAQTPQAHFGLIDALRHRGSDDQRQRFFSAALDGQRFANAIAERGTPRADVRLTRLVRSGEGRLVLRGRKYYSTGALTADWIAVLAPDENEQMVYVLIPGDAPGVTRVDDWSGFGQRATNSGTTLLDDVPVEHDQILGRGAGDDGDDVDTIAPATQLVHAAIHVGIARGAFDEGVSFVRNRSRPWREAGVERAAEEPHVILRVGALATRLKAAEALLDWAAQTLDEVRSAPITEESATRAVLAVDQAKAFGAEIALQVSSEILEVAGTSATDEADALDRWWRNARTHTLHDPARWKLHHVGAHILLGETPPLTLA